MSFKNVVEKYGIPAISKEQAQYLYEAKNTKSEKLRDLRINGNHKSGSFKISSKYLYLLDKDVKISHKCCDILKKNPVKRYEKLSGNSPILGIMASESNLRTSEYRKYGCNVFDSNRPKSRPMMFWNESDIWEYIRRYKTTYSSIYDKGYDRTGCMLCMFGCMATKDNRMKMLKDTHKKNI